MSPEEKYAWVVNTLLVEHLNFGFDFVIHEPIPQWFFDDMVTAWVAKEGEPEEDIRYCLDAEGFVVE